MLCIRDCLLALAVVSLTFQSWVFNNVVWKLPASYENSRSAYDKLNESASDLPCKDEFPLLSFNEKVQWRMQHDRRPVLPFLADKLLVRDLAAARGVPAAPLLYSGTCSGIPRLKDLPSSFAFKASHHSGCNFLVIDNRIVAHKICLGTGEDHLEGLLVSDEILHKHCTLWLSRLYIYRDREWAYSMMTPKLMIEGLLRKPSDSIDSHGLADDMKCYTFNGQTAYVIQVSNRFASGSGSGDSVQKTDTFYDADGTPRPELGYGDSSALPAERYLSADIISQASAMCNRIGVGVDFARIDLLLTGDGKLFLGEVTLYPMGGHHKWRPAGFDMELSRHWCSHGAEWQQML